MTLHFQLENVAINDVLPLKAARRCAIANVKCFGGPGHQRPNFDGCILHSLCGATLFGSQHGHLTSVLQC